MGDFAFKATNALRARHLSVDCCRRVARKVGTTPGADGDADPSSVVQAAAGGAPWRRVTVRARVSSLCDKMLAWRLRRVRCSYLWRLFVTVTRLRRDVTVVLRNCHSTESVPNFRHLSSRHFPWVSRKPMKAFKPFFVSPPGLPCSSHAQAAPLAPASNRRGAAALPSCSRRRFFCVDDQPLKSLGPPIRLAHGESVALAQHPR